MAKPRAPDNVISIWSPSFGGLHFHELLQLLASFLWQESHGQIQVQIQQDLGWKTYIHTYILPQISCDMGLVRVTFLN